MKKALVPALALMMAAPALAERGSDGELCVRYRQAASVLNPCLSTGARNLDPASLIPEPLALMAGDGSLIPVLADVIPTVENGGIAEDFTSVTWLLKPGLSWSDGSPVTAADVARDMTGMLTADGHVILPLVHRGRIPAHANSLAVVVQNGREGSLWNIADWSRAP